MRFLYLSFLLILSGIAFSQQSVSSFSLDEQPNTSGTASTQVLNTLDGGDNKVIISEGNNGIEFSPLDPTTNGGLIQPINRITNTGISTSFYLHDTSSWLFYTNGLERLKIGGSNNNITVSAPLLINTVNNDNNDKLRVNGNIRVDSNFTLQADSLSYISLNNGVKEAYLNDDDTYSPYTGTPTAWAGNQHLPVFRIRHPNNVSGIPSSNISIQRDFKILPYQYGMAIEFNGVVECWTGEWSIHRGINYYDVERKGNGWGGVLWVGDDEDLGGIRATARDNTTSGGDVNYAEISAEKFAGGPHGDFRFRLPSTQNDFHFVYGERGSTNIIAKMKNEGLVVPKISSVAAAQSPEKAQIVFDSTANEFKGYNGNTWSSLGGNNTLITGSYNVSSNGNDIVYAIPHGLNTTPSYFNVIATSPDAGGFRYVTADATNLYINYFLAPSTGTNNLSWNWQVKQ